MRYLFQVLLLSSIASCGLVGGSSKGSRSFDTDNAQEPINSEEQVASSDNVIASKPQKSTVKNISYGSLPDQKLDLYFPDGDRKKLPLAIMVHGGGWQTGSKGSEKVIGSKKDFFLSRGYVFASIDYRLAPENKYPDAPYDVALAISWLKGQADTLGIDKSKVVILGHSAGAHLVSLITTNQKFLREYKVATGFIKAVISLDTYFYDIERFFNDERLKLRGKFIVDFFGTDREAMKEGSPLLHVNSNTPPFLIFSRSSENEAELKDESDFVKKLESYGTQVSQKIILDYTHDQFNSLFGKKGDIMTDRAEIFLDSLGL